MTHGHVNRAPAADPPMSKLKHTSLGWKYSTGTLLNRSPVVRDGIVYVGTTDGHLYGLDAVSGYELERYAFDWEVIDFLPEPDGGLIYVGCRNLTALESPTGSIAWEASPGIWTSSEPIVVGRRIFVTGTTAGDSDEFALFALNASTGVVEWRCPLGYTNRGRPAILGDTVYVTSGRTGSLVAIDTGSGEPRWRVDFEAQTNSGACVDGTLIYVGTAAGLLYAFDASDGDEIWRLEIGNGAVWPCLADQGLLYVTNMDWNVRGGFVTAHSAATGDVIWRVSSGETASFKPILNGNSLFAGSTEGYFSKNLFHALDARTGKERWRVRAPFSTGISDTPAVAKNRWYVPNYDGAVYAIDIVSNED